MTDKTLIVITGPTASGKSDLAVDVASALGCDIISADSRQMFRDIPVGTAAPTPAQLAAVRHHFVGTLALDDYYSASRFEADVMALLPSLWQKSDYAVMCGGSMMYIDAVTDGIDPLPDITPATRDRVREIVYGQGLDAALALLEVLDPVYAAEVDRANHRRVAHALEISMQSGRPYSELRCGSRPPRPFKIVKFAIDMPRQELYGRINRRVGLMVENGLVDEARRVFHLRHLNSLNTVGYKELFAFFDGTISFERALESIARNTRVYAKKQLTWLARTVVRPSVPLPHGTSAAEVIDILGQV